MNESIGKPDHTLLVQGFRIPDAAPRFHAGERKKCGAAELILLQKCNHPLCSVLIVCYDILDTSAKSCLDRDLVFLIYLDNISDYSDQAFFFLLVRHHFSDTVSVPVVALGNIFERFQP